ncbi:MAG: hypothetical protein WCA46_05770 [Actinocatenispora sp.]
MPRFGLHMWLLLPWMTARARRIANRELIHDRQLAIRLALLPDTHRIHVIDAIWAERHERRAVSA